MSAIFKEHGAANVVGVDHDKEAIELARGIYPYHADFAVDDISLELLSRIPDYGVIIWTSQFMWMVKQHGMEHALDFIFELSQKCETLVFETAGRDDGSAPLDMDQTEILPMLINNTCFQKITDHGPWGDNWAPRNVFVCENPLQQHLGEWSSAGLYGRYKKERGKFYKWFHVKSFSKELKARELKCLELLQGYPYFPQVLDSDEDSITMTYEGLTAIWLPEGDVNRIIELLKEFKITHRDIRPENLLWNGRNIVLIDWSFATFEGEVTNYHYDLGGKYKCPHGFNDEYSLRKVQQELL